MSKPKNQRFSLFSGLVRIVLWCILVIIALVIIVPVAVLLFFNPNDYKKEINAFLADKTGSEVTVAGNIELKFFPWLGLNVQQVSFGHSEKFGNEPLISIKEIGFKIPIRELIQNHLTIETLILKGVALNMVKLQDGTANWDAFTKRAKGTQNQSATTSTSSIRTDELAKAPTKHKLSFEISRFTVQDTSIVFEDKTQNHIYTLNHLQLNGHRQENTYPVTGNFDLNMSDQNKAALLGEGKFEGTFLIQNAKTTANFNTTLSLKMPGQSPNWQNLTFASTVKADFAKELLFEKLDLQSKATHMTGNCRLPTDTKAPIEINLSFSQLNTDDLPKSVLNTHSAVSSSHQARSSSVAPEIENTPSKAVTRSLIGNISIDTINHKNLTLHNVKTSIKRENNLLKANSTAELYEGKLTAQLSQNLNTPNAPMQIVGNMKQIQIQPLLQDLKQQSHLAGQADIDFNLAQTKQTNGIVKFNITKGVLNGVDVKYYLSKAQALLSKTESLENNNQKTPFDEFKGTLNIHDNIIDNNDLIILSPDFKANGEGSINLQNQTLAYKLQAWRLYADGSQRPNALPLAIRIKGNLSHPKIEPDLDLYLKAVLKNEVRKELNKQIEKNLSKIIPDSPSDKQDGSADPGSASPQDKAKKKLEDKIEKGLKKFFKKP